MSFKPRSSNYDPDPENDIISSMKNSEPFDIIADENQMLYEDGEGNIYDPNGEFYHRNPKNYYSNLRPSPILNQRLLKSASTTVTQIPDATGNDPNNTLRVKQPYAILKQIYPDSFMNRLANAFFFDDVVNAALTRLSYFVLGTDDEIKATLYPITNKKIQTELEARNRLKEINIVRSGIDIGGSIINNHFSDQEIDDLEMSLHQIDRIVNLGSVLRQNWVSAHIFGRSASYVDYSSEAIPELGIPAGVPSAIKPLKSMYLGNVAINPVNWTIKAIEYKEPKVEFKEYVDVYGISNQDQELAQFYDTSAGSTESFASGYVPPGSKFIDANNLLYFVRNNFQLMREEDLYWFGLSTLQPILSISEENRRINRIILPQLNQSAWASAGVWFAPSWTKQQRSNFLLTLKPGTHSAVNQPGLDYKEIKLTHDYKGILEQQDQSKKKILSMFGLPSFLMNFENVTNRATSESVLAGFNESMIASERAWLSKILDQQWYPRIFSLFFPQDQYIHMKLKMMIEFENITFESFLERAAAVSVLVEKGLFTNEEGRRMLKIQTAIDQPVSGATTAANQQNPMMQQQQGQGQQQQQASGGTSGLLNTGSANSSSGKAIATSSMTLLNKYLGNTL